jgi:conjugal transfer pilus assembly protein TrbC
MTGFQKRALVGAVTALLVVPGWAADPVTASDIAQQQQLIEQQRKVVYDPNNPATQVKGDFPDDKQIADQMQQIDAARKPMFDGVDANQFKGAFPNVPTSAPSNVDIEQIAKRYERKVHARKIDDLMVFASFSMPPETLKKIIHDVHLVGGTVVLRGFKNNSVQDTALAIKDLGESSGSIVVNPNAFDKYKITAVPTLVLAKAEALGELDGTGCALPDAYAAVSGDVSLKYALEVIAQRRKDYADLADRYGRQLGGNL